MIDTQKLFGNFFDDVRITPSCFISFSQNALNNFINDNTAAQYTALITTLTPLVAAAANELGDVDTSLNIQKGSTLTNDQVLHNFSDTMSSQEPFIAAALGGRSTPEYLQFYPHKISEYTKATKLQMPTLTQRVNTAATANAVALGATLTTLLQGFEDAWNKSRNAQQQQMGDVKSNRNQRTDALTALETAMLTAVHTVAGMFPGNVQQCNALFNFNPLFAQTKHKHISLTGTIVAGHSVSILNRTLKDSNTIAAANTDVNAAWCLYLGATATAPAPESVIVLQPGEHKIIKPSELGNLQNPFLIIKNISDVNDGNYELDIEGIEKGDGE